MVLWWKLLEADILLQLKVLSGNALDACCAERSALSTIAQDTQTLLELTWKRCMMGCDFETNDTNIMVPAM